MKKKSGNFVNQILIQLAKNSFLNDSLYFVIPKEKNSGNSRKECPPLLLKTSPTWRILLTDVEIFPILLKKMCFFYLIIRSSLFAPKKNCLGSSFSEPRQLQASPP